MDFRPRENPDFKSIICSTQSVFAGHLREPGQMFAGQGAAAVADAAQVEVEAPAVIEVAPVREVGAARDIAGGHK